MASTTVAILSTNAGEFPHMGTMPAAANQLYPKGTIVTRDASGRAVSPSTSDVSGFPAMGVSKASYDNRTAGPSGGAAAAIDVEIAYGVMGFAYVGTVPLPSDRLYVVDNKTVSTSDLGGTRGFAGICSAVRTANNGVATAFCYMGPHVAGQSGSGGASVATVPVPIMSALLLATGAPMAVFANGASTVPGVQVTDSEINSVRWNNDAAPAAVVQTVYVPAASDVAAPMVIHALVSKTGATVGDATSLTIAAFGVAVGDLHDADADFGGTSSAVVGNAVAKTMSELTLTLAGVDVPDTAFALSLSIKPTAGTLGTDDFCLHAMWVTR